MREIKFKFWDTMLKESTKYYSAPPQDIFEFDQDRYVALQYTGLKDKNGVEIYEGDILKCNGGAEDFFCLIGFEEGCFIAKMPWVKKDKEFCRASYPELKYYVNMTFVSIEVIGNIFENPELLKVKND